MENIREKERNLGSGVGKVADGRFVNRPYEYVPTVRGANPEGKGRKG